MYQHPKTEQNPWAMSLKPSVSVSPNDAAAFPTVFRTLDIWLPKSTNPPSITSPALLKKFPASFAAFRNPSARLSPNYVNPATTMSKPSSKTLATVSPALTTSLIAILPYPLILSRT